MAPERAIAAERGRLIEMEVPSGRSVGELDAALGSAGLGEGVGSLTYSRARDSVLFSRVVTAASQGIVEAPLDGGQEAQVVANGHTVAPAPDGQQVAFELQFEDGTGTRILDVAAEDGSLQGVSQQVEPVGDLRMLSAPQFRPDDGALVAVDGPGLDPDARQHWRIVALTPTGDVEDVLDETDRAVTQLDFDVTGQHLLYVLSHDHPPPDQEPVDPAEVMYWHDGASTEVRQGITDVAW